MATLRSPAAVDAAADDEDDVATLDFSPGSEAEGNAEATRRKLLAFARRAETLTGAADTKLQGAVREIKGLLKDDFQPIVFCRFVDTADYVARQLREVLPTKVRVESVTGLLPPVEREARIETLVKDGGEYVLVCTDCLSEGVNLQQAFNAVLHYDLCWNPTRYEQREGRVDRFGQNRPEVCVITYYGEDNPIDGLILEVLIRKHKSIKSDLGVTVAVPGSSEKIAEALFEGALVREITSSTPQQINLDFGDVEEAQVKVFHAEWESAHDKEKASRSRFAQHTLDKDTVAAELKCVREAIGRSEDVARFVRDVLQVANVPVQERGPSVTVHLSNETPRALRQAMGHDEPFTGRFDLPLEESEIYLGRTSPIVEGLAGWTLDQALDPVSCDARPIASRCGVITTSAVTSRTTLLLARFRYHLRIAGASGKTILCEENAPLACSGPATRPQWLGAEASERLLTATPGRNLVQTAIDQQIGLLTEALPALQQALAAVAKERTAVQLQAHERVREAVKAKGRVTIEPVLPVDILGAYILLPRL